MRDRYNLSGRDVLQNRPGGRLVKTIDYADAIGQCNAGRDLHRLGSLGKGCGETGGNENE